MALPKIDDESFSEEAIVPRRGITLRSVVLGAATAASLCVWTNYTEFVMHSAALVMSNLPMSAFIPFVFWLFLNTLIRAWRPQVALSGTELLVVLGMSWMVGNVPAIGWTGYWSGIMTAPEYYASPENGWRTSFFNVLPSWLFPDPAVVPWFYNGLPPHTSLPWSGWVVPMFWWGSVSLAIVGLGICTTVIFRRQWIEHEKLTFPLAMIPMDLTDGFNEPGRRVPALFRNPLFWFGVAIPGIVIGWNIIGYFNPGMPRIMFFAGYSAKQVTFARQFPPYAFRILPSLIAFTYFCNLDILLSFWLFGLLATFKIGVMNRLGVTIGLPGQPSKPPEILGLESHGALIALAVWSFWVGRKHLADVFRRAFSADRSVDDDGGVMSYRSAVLGWLVSWLFLVGWLTAAGQGLFFAIVSSLLMFAAYFCTTKFLAASGFAYLFPPDVNAGGFLKTMFGSARMSNEQLMGIQLHNSGAFVGGGRIMGMPMMPHYVKMMEKIKDKRWLVPSLWIAFIAGVVASFVYTLDLCYTEAGLNLRTYTLVTGNTATFNALKTAIDGANRTVPDTQKLIVWLIGAAEVLLLSGLRTWLPWWPLHPVGLAFQNSIGVRVFGFSAFLAWVIKLVIMRLGGMGLFNKFRPVFLGILIGYAAMIGISAFVDAMWFPGRGHWVHGW
jgi:hypothetical protein